MRNEDMLELRRKVVTCIESEGWTVIDQGQLNDGTLADVYAEKDVSRIHLQIRPLNDDGEYLNFGENVVYIGVAQSDDGEFGVYEKSIKKVVH